MKGVAIVTGAGRGIGKAIVHALSAEGFSIVLAARTASELEATADECRRNGARALAVPTDLRDEHAIRQLVQTAHHQFGRVDILVNNAGIGFFKPVVDLSVEEVDAMWAVNVRAVFIATREVLPLMVSSGGGVIVTIASLAGKNAVRDGAVYSATKWALRGFASSLMLEVREHNIRVVTIFPGSVDTSFSRRSKDRKTITKPEDVAAAVLFAATAPARSMVSEIDIRPTNP